MLYTVKKLETEHSIIEFYTRNGVMSLEINDSKYGYSYEDYSDWDISDEEYYKIENLVDSIIDQMEIGSDTAYWVE